ncbi:Transcriptional regulatory protein BaeR [Labrenzia sp. THAF82]|uniref:response regulator transcription factor n=1 Tax=Labrenzia sp. THAF82 TaxID=2587861 RepID=UPI0012697DFE|nr:response regulator transcription factor [Labrenzia sp. THAF82]QFT30724.1 Transcriptional regulatory protein BaeR [Labrenzia sp. THAF82]
MIPNILIVDDDAHLRGIVRIAVENAGMSTAEASSGQHALDIMQQQMPDLVILDVGMPVMNGFDCCRHIRSLSRVPILFLTARDEEVDRVVGFELGADDYVSKPFSPRELVLRIKAILGRGKGTDEDLLQHGDLQLDTRAHQCRLGSKELPLTATEFALLTTLLHQPDKMLDRNTLIEGMYGRNSALSGRTIDSHVRNVRAKAASLDCPDFIRTVRGAGLRLGTCKLEQDTQ